MPHSLQAQPGEGPGVVVLDVRKMGTRVSCEGRGLGHMGGAWSLGQGLTVNAELSGKVGTHAEGWAGRTPGLMQQRPGQSTVDCGGSLRGLRWGWSGLSLDHWDG